MREGLPHQQITPVERVCLQVASSLLCITDAFMIGFNIVAMVVA